MTLESLQTSLGSVLRGEYLSIDSDHTHQAFATLKKSAVDSGDEQQAKAVWCLEEAYSAISHYFEAFIQLKNQSFYDAWCSLERAEIGLLHVQRQSPRLFADLELRGIQDMVRQWQSLYPYKLFLSVEMVIKRSRCSICGCTKNLRRCGHIVGDIYGGEMCVRVVEDMEFLGAAIVRSPMNKYAVLFRQNPGTGESHDQYEYPLVKYAADRLSRPLDTWSYEMETRLVPHDGYREVGRNGPCPCGSARKYKRCCLQKSGVTLPHYQFEFAALPPSGLRQEEVVLRAPRNSLMEVADDSRKYMARLLR